MKNVTVAELKANREADKAVSEIDDAVRESVAALDSGKIRPSASGLVRHASGLVRDASGLVRDASGLVRDASGLVRNEETAELYRGLAGKVDDLSVGAARFSRYVRRVVNLRRVVNNEGRYSYMAYTRSTIPGIY